MLIYIYSRNKYMNLSSGCQMKMLFHPAWLKLSFCFLNYYKQYVIKLVVHIYIIWNLSLFERCQKSDRRL